MTALQMKNMTGIKQDFDLRLSKRWIITTPHFDPSGTSMGNPKM
jgi:hypothetical protein